MMAQRYGLDRGFLLRARRARRISNAVIAWTDLEDLAAYAWLAQVGASCGGLDVGMEPLVPAFVAKHRRWC